MTRSRNRPNIQRLSPRTQAHIRNGFAALPDIVAIDFETNMPDVSYMTLADLERQIAETMTRDGATIAVDSVTQELSNVQQAQLNAANFFVQGMQTRRFSSANPPLHFIRYADEVHGSARIIDEPWQPVTDEAALLESLHHEWYFKNTTPGDCLARKNAEFMAHYGGRVRAIQSLARPLRSNS